MREPIEPQPPHAGDEAEAVVTALATLFLACAALYPCLDVDGGAAARTVALAALVLVAAPLCAPPAAARGFLLWCAAVACGVALCGALAFGAPALAALRVAAVLGAWLVACLAPGPDARSPARGLLTSVALAFAGLAPLWLGPAAALAGDPRVGDLALAVSPLVHLASAADLDLLRTTWFYAHSLLGSLRFTYPPWPWVLAGTSLLAALAAARSAAARARTRAACNRDASPW